MIALGDRPRLARRARLRVDRLRGQHLLLYPERGLVLSPTAHAVLDLCRGELTVAELIAELGACYEGVVAEEVTELLEALQAKGLLELTGAP